MLMKILFALIALTVIVPVALYYKSGKTKGKECLLMNAISFFSILGVGVICTLGGGVSALAAGGIAVASAASAAIGAMSENEKIMGKTLIFVALAEGIALYGLVISILILNS